MASANSDPPSHHAQQSVHRFPEAAHHLDEGLDVVRDIRGLVRTVMVKVSKDAKRSEDDAAQLRDSIFYDMRPITGHVEIHLCADDDAGMKAGALERTHHTEVHAPDASNKQKFSEKILETIRRTGTGTAKEDTQIAIPLKDSDVRAMGMDVAYTLDRHPFLFRYHEHVRPRIVIIGDLKNLGTVVHQEWVKEKGLQGIPTYWYAIVVLDQQGMNVANPFYVGKGVATNDNQVEIALFLDEKAIYERSKSSAAESTFGNDGK